MTGMAPVQYNSYLVYAKIPPLWHSELQILAIINDCESVTRPHNSAGWAAASSASRLGKASPAGRRCIVTVDGRSNAGRCQPPPLQPCSVRWYHSVISVAITPQLLALNQLDCAQLSTATWHHWCLHSASAACRAAVSTFPRSPRPSNHRHNSSAHPFWRCISSLPSSRPTLVFIHCTVHSSHVVTTWYHHSLRRLCLLLRPLIDHVTTCLRISRLVAQRRNGAYVLQRFFLSGRRSFLCRVRPINLPNMILWLAAVVRPSSHCSHGCRKSRYLYSQCSLVGRALHLTVPEGSYICYSSHLLRSSSVLPAELEYLAKFPCALRWIAWWRKIAGGCVVTSRVFR